MNGYLVAVLVVVGLAVFIVGAVLAAKAARERREALAALARSLGWSFDPGEDTSHDDEFAQFEVFRRGHSRKAYNTLVGALTVDGRGFPARMGDFTYKVTRQSGKSTTTTTYRFSYLILRVPFPGTPDLLIRREGLFDKIAGAIGFDDIDFESAEFSRRFCVKSPDKRFAYAVVHPRMMEFLMQEGFPGVDLEHGACCFTDGRSRWSPEQFRERLRWGEQFFGLWPDHLTRELEQRAS